MVIFSPTSIVINGDNSKLFGLPQFYYRCRSCNTNLTGNTPSQQYQRLKLIQNSVRVPSSLYIMNKASLSAYRKPSYNYKEGFYGVCWNQMSDRPYPSLSKAVIPTGFSNSLSGKHHSVTSSKPGCMTPGGKGVDIKHNSYERYLNRIKAKGPLRRGFVPPYFGGFEPFNNAYPIYGGKTLKTNIISNCDCPLDATPNNIKNQNMRLYDLPNGVPCFWLDYPSATYGFNVGAFVYAIKTGTDFYSKAVVISVVDGVYNIQFSDGTNQIVTNVNELLTYLPCNCNINNKQTFINFYPGYSILFQLQTIFKNYINLVENF